MSTAARPRSARWSQSAPASAIGRATSASRLLAGLLGRVGCATEAEVARRRVGLVAVAGGYSVAPTIRRMAQMRPALLHLARPGWWPGGILATVLGSETWVKPVCRP